MGAPHILIVAFDEEAGELYALQLALSLRARTTWVRDCVEARHAIAHGRRYEAVLFDVAMPAEWDDCLALPNERPDTPVIVVTGWIAHDRRFQQRAFDAGCAAFVAKPCTGETLSEALGRVWRGERRVELMAASNGLLG
jgi:DNA-binding NtrC family response regulator